MASALNTIQSAITGNKPKTTTASTPSSTSAGTIGSTATVSPSGNTTSYGNGITVINRPTNTPPANTGVDMNALQAEWDAYNHRGTKNTGDGSGTDNNPSGFNNLSNGSGGGSGGGYYRGGGSSGGGGGGGSYTAPILPSATSQEAYIRSMYDANEQAARENLRSAYETNMAALDREAGRLPETYDTAVDAANTQAAINRLNFNEQAAMSGLNTGAGSQARLSQNNALLGNVSSIRRAQADAQADLDFQRTQMEAQYQQAIREAVAKNDLEKAQALYQEAKRVDESIVNTAINQANLNWSIWKTLYG